MDEPEACYTEWSKSEREKKILTHTHTHTYMEPIGRAAMEM